jgi:predicted small integral membrane protein
MIEARIAKATMVASLALFALLVTFDNLTDYDTNYAFVRHVLSMDTTFPGSAGFSRPRHPRPNRPHQGSGIISATATAGS